MLRPLAAKKLLTTFFHKEQEYNRRKMCSIKKFYAYRSASIGNTELLNSDSEWSCSSVRFRKIRFIVATSVTHGVSSPSNVTIIIALKRQFSSICSLSSSKLSMHHFYFIVRLFFLLYPDHFQANLNFQLSSCIPFSCFFYNYAWH